MSIKRFKTAALAPLLLAARRRGDRAETDRLEQMLTYARELERALPRD
jgi:hypothetical protein